MQRPHSTEPDSSRGSAAEEQVIEGVLCGVNHQLRTPLNGILASVDLLAATPLSDRQRTLMSIIADAAETLLGSVEDLLAVAAGAGPEPRRRVCETSQELANLLEPHRARLADQSRELIVNIHADVPAQSAAPWDLIATIVDHLVDNAQTYAVDGPVTVELAHAELGWALLKVSDEGIGIPAEWIDQVTRPFARVDTSLTAPPGAGLGLAVARRAVDHMQGSLSIASTPGDGTVVTCRLPLESVAASNPASGVELDTATEVTTEVTPIPPALIAPTPAAATTPAPAPPAPAPPAPVVPVDAGPVNDGSDQAPTAPPLDKPVVLVAMVDPDVRTALIEAVEATDSRTVIADTVDDALFKVDTAAQLGSPVSCALIDPSIVDRRGRALDLILGRRDEVVATMAIQWASASTDGLDRVEAFVREHRTPDGDGPPPVEQDVPNEGAGESVADSPVSGDDPVNSNPSTAEAAAADTTVTPVASDPASADGEPGPLKILVAEDNTTNQLVIRTLLERLGHTAVLVENGQLAVDAILNDSFDMILMDCMMPELDGFGATEAIRELDEPACSTPILALTANAMKGDRERCLDAGMDEYLSKPVRLDLLKEMIHLLIVEGVSARR